MGIQFAEAAGGGFDAGVADAVGGHQDLAVEIGSANIARVGEDELSDTGGGEIIGGGTANASDSGDENARGFEFLLTGLANVWGGDLPLIAGVVVFGEGLSVVHWLILRRWGRRG
jgi:hypothetical protein